MRLVGKDGKNLVDRAQAFAVRVVKLTSALPKTTQARQIGVQLFRSGTSVGAQLAEADHAKSRADFISKVEGALQELEESRYWMNLLVESKVVRAGRLQPLIGECSELIAILVTIARRSQSPGGTGR